MMNQRKNHFLNHRKTNGRDGKGMISLTMLSFRLKPLLWGGAFRIPFSYELVSLILINFKILRYVIQ